MRYPLLSLKSPPPASCPSFSAPTSEKESEEGTSIMDDFHSYLVQQTERTSPSEARRRLKPPHAGRCRETRSNAEPKKPSLALAAIVDLSSLSPAPPPFRLFSFLSSLVDAWSCHSLPYPHQSHSRSAMSNNKSSAQRATSHPLLALVLFSPPPPHLSSIRPSSLRRTKTAAADRRGCERRWLCSVQRERGGYASTPPSCGFAFLVHRFLPSNFAY